MITIEVELAEFFDLAFDCPVAIRNAVVNAMGEPLRLTRVGGASGCDGYDPRVPPWFEFAAETQWDEE